MTEVTEFTWIDPDEMHLVGVPANGFAAPLLAKAAEALEEQDSYSADGMVKYVSAEARRKYADSGVAMDNGDFPIPDEGHLRSAIGHLGNYKGDKAKAKAHIIKRAKALGLTHLLPKDWNVSKAEKETAPDKSLPRSEAESQTEEVSEDVSEGCDPDNEDGGDLRHVAAEDETPAEGDGEGTTAPDKAVPRAEADSQTAQKDVGDGTGTTAPDAEGETERAEHEARTQTNEVAKDTPGSPEWEHKDVALGEKAERLVSQIGEVVQTLTEREKAEGGASKSARNFIAAVEHLATPTHINLLKEFADMSDTTELVKALDELGKARREKAAKKADAKKAEKREKKAAKAAKKAAQAADTESPELAKARAELAALQSRVEKMESEDAKRVVTDPSGIVTALRGGAEGAANVFKQLEDDLSAAKEAFEKNPSRANEARMQDAGKRLVSAKLIAQDTSRTADPSYVAASLRGIGFPLFRNDRPFHDPAVRDVR